MWNQCGAECHVYRRVVEDRVRVLVIVKCIFVFKQKTAYEMLRILVGSEMCIRDSFGSMYEGSMVGAGACVFAVMGYIIAKQVPNRTVGSQVRLNPSLLSAILGEPKAEIEKAIKFLCAPDALSLIHI